MISAVRMNLSRGAQAKNIFWQVSGAVALGTTCHFEGNLLGATSKAVQTGATINGRLLAQTAVTLQMNTVTAEVEYFQLEGNFNDDVVVFWINPEVNGHGLVCGPVNVANNPRKMVPECIKYRCNK
jgi:hypothetical protein